MRRLLFCILLLLLKTKIIHAQEPNSLEKNKPKLYFGLSLLFGGSLIKYVTKVPKPITLGYISEFTDSKISPLASIFEFSYFKNSDRTTFGEYYFLSYGLLYPRALLGLDIFGGYSLMLALFKETLSSRENAIVFHDFFISPFLGLKQSFYKKEWFEIKGTAAVHAPTHSLKEMYLQVGVESAFTL